MIFLFATGYSAFQTVISINAKGNIKQSNFYVASNGSDVNGNGTISNPYATVEKAYNSIEKKGNIYIMNNILLTSILNMNDNKKIKLASYNTNNEVYSIIRENVLTDTMINIANGNVTLEDIIIDGNDVSATYPPIKIRANASLTMEKQSKIINGNSNSSAGGAIRIDNNSNVTLTINDGLISNNKGKEIGGAIHCGPNNIIIINGGEISNNYASYRGGAISLYGSLIMNGGKIVDNTAGDAAGAIYIAYQGNNIGHMTMNNGLISNNSASYSGGIYFDYGYGIFTYNNGVICENTPVNSYETHSTCPN